MHALVLLCINQYTKFEVPSVTDSPVQILTLIRFMFFCVFMLRRHVSGVLRPVIVV